MAIEDIYRRDLAYIHDVGYGSSASDAAETLVQALAGLDSRGGTVVELGCGSGILAGHLVDAGYRVLGVDLSADMVSLARTRVPNADFRIGSFVSADLPACVAVAAIGEVLSYVADAGNDSGARDDLFRRVYDALVPGGVLVFDIAGLDRAHGSRACAEAPDWAVIAETELEAATGLLKRSITTFRRVGELYRRDAEVHQLALLDPTVVMRSLRTVGFEAHILAGYGASPLPRGVVPFLCRKPGRMPA